MLSVFPTDEGFFFCLFCVFLLYFSMAVFSEDEERSLGFRIGGYFVMIHAFIGGFRIGPDAAWIEIGSLFYQACDFSLDSGFSGFQTQLAGFPLPYLFMH